MRGDSRPPRRSRECHAFRSCQAKLCTTQHGDLLVRDNPMSVPSPFVSMLRFFSFLSRHHGNQVKRTEKDSFNKLKHVGHTSLENTSSEGDTCSSSAMNSTACFSVFMLYGLQPVIRNILNRTVVDIAQSHHAKRAQVQLDELFYSIHSIFLKERHRTQLLFCYQKESLCNSPESCNKQFHATIKS